ncbi:transcription termination factor MTERF15, mitochondrial [Magnolia sinica]|uniref:transcription termination factor MTERF15, mitochondrial n=1 Tax=Magnolia sinica TaxID=86752 RepID=UPI0026584CE9|nr:transcription termination factor MTERF15, mitochondrial [Magnolia sinica]
MAIRVLLTRSPILSKFPNIQTNPIQKIQSFTKTPNLPPKIPSRFQENPQIKHLIPVSNLLRRYGLPSSRLHEFLQKNRFLLKSNPSDIEKSLGILLSFKLSQKSLVSILISCPRVLELGFLRKWEMGFSELGFQNATPSLIQNVLEQFGRFQIDPDEFFQNLRVLKDAGLSDETLIKVLTECPRLVMVKGCDLDHWIEFFKGIGVRCYEFDRICYLFPGVLGLRIENQLRSLFEEFDELGFGWIEVRKAVIRDPRVLSMEVGELSYYIQFLRNLKCRLPIKEKITHNGIFQAGMEVKSRVDCLCRHGLIRREAFKVLQREPRTIIYELEDVEKKIDFLLYSMRFGIDCLLEVPEYLGVNFEKQIVPRYNVIEYLRSIGGLGFDVGLKGMIRPSRLKFYNLYVKPYPECENIFGRFPRDVEVRTRQPVGLWKLFKPQKFPDSKEDLKNMKSFMEALV